MLMKKEKKKKKNGQNLKRNKIFLFIYLLIIFFLADIGFVLNFHPSKQYKKRKDTPLLPWEYEYSDLLKKKKKKKKKGEISSPWERFCPIIF